MRDVNFSHLFVRSFIFLSIFSFHVEVLETNQICCTLSEVSYNMGYICLAWHFAYSSVMHSMIQRAAIYTENSVSTGKLIMVKVYEVDRRN